MRTKALIYCRVSSQRQVIEGHGNSSQEQRCRNRAKEKGYPVEMVFPDDGVSGGLFERPAMQRLIAYLDEHPTENYVIIFDDLARFARDLEVHLKLRKELVGRGAKLECLNFNFEDSPEGIFIENVLASKAQLDRQQNRRQVIQKMKARMESGYWPFMLPRGLINKKDPIQGKIAILREPFATIYKVGIEKYCDGILPSIDAFQAYVKVKYKEYGINSNFAHATATKTLKEILYAGYIDYPKWNVTRRKAKHQGFISLETYEIVQERLAGRAKKWHRKDYNLDFPLRPFVVCENCGTPLSGAYNTGRSGERYPHYYCRGKGCKYIWKSIPKRKFENQFEQLLIQVKPVEGLADLTKDVLNEAWNHRLETYSTSRNASQNELKKINDDIDDYVKRVGKTEDEILIDIYEAKIKELAKQKRELEAQLQQHQYTDKDFGTASEKVFNTLKDPMSMWKSEEYNDKRTILFMYFEENLCYDYERGFGTAGLAYPIKLISEIGQAKSDSVEMSSCELECKNISKKHLQA